MGVFAYRLSRLSEFDRIIGNDRIDVCLNVFTSALIFTVVSWRSTGLFKAWIFRLLSFTCFHELCLALASLWLLIALHEYSIIFKEIEDCMLIIMLWWLSAVFLAQLRRWPSIVIACGLYGSLQLYLLLLLLLRKICWSWVGERPIHVLEGLLL